MLYVARGTGEFVGMVEIGSGEVDVQREGILPDRHRR